MIAHLDKRFGDLERFLADEGLRDDTIVVFMTDNGGTAGVRTYNAGLRAGKTTYYEGGHRVPCWVRWPAGKLGEPRDIDTPTHIQDVLPTLLELCDVKPGGAKFDGTSLAGLLRGTQKELPDRMLVVQYGQVPEKWDSCVIWNKWRLVAGKDPGAIDLFLGGAVPHAKADQTFIGPRADGGLGFTVAWLVPR